MRAIPFVLGLVALGGCAEPIEKLGPSEPPETLLTSGPPDSTSATSYRVHFSWSGTDPDGAVDHFEFIMVDHPAANDSISGGTSPVTITVPEPDDPRWTPTSGMDSTFVTLADTLRRDPRPGPR